MFTIKKKNSLMVRKAEDMKERRMRAPMPKRKEGKRKWGTDKIEKVRK
jgi:hypothetical protein